MNQLANNGWASAVNAAWTRNLEFDAYYVSLPRGEAFRRVRKLLEEPGATFVGPEVADAPMPNAQGKLDEGENEKWLDAARLSLTRDIAGDPVGAAAQVTGVLRTLGADELARSYGETLQAVRRVTDAALSLRRTSEGLYRRLDDRTALGATFTRRAELYKPYAAVERQASLTRQEERHARAVLRRREHRARLEL